MPAAIPSSTTLHATSNGHLSPLPSTLPNGIDASPGSESALSEVADPNLIATSPPSGLEESADEEEDVEAEVEMDVDEDMSSEENEVVSEDGEFDLESPPPAETNGALDDRSTSNDSRRPAKRKAGVEDDDYIINNPELYGLRRSVSLGHASMLHRP